MSVLLQIRLVPEGTHVQIANRVIYGSDKGVHGAVDFYVEEADRSESGTTLMGKDPVGNRIRYVFDNEQSNMPARVFAEDASKMAEDLRPGDVIAAEGGIGEVLKDPVDRTGYIAVAVRRLDNKAINWHFRPGERVDIVPSHHLRGLKKEEKEPSRVLAMYRRVA